MLNLNVKGIVNKLTSNADKLGLLYGYLLDPMSNGRGLSGAPDFILDRITHWKVPKIESIINGLMWGPYKEGLKTALMAYLAGEGLEAIGEGKWGKVAKKAGVGVAKGVGLAAITLLPAINPRTNPSSGSSGNYGGGNSPSWGYQT